MVVVPGGPKARRAYRLLLGVELRVNTMLVVVGKLPAKQSGHTGDVTTSVQQPLTEGVQLRPGREACVAYLF
jgi:hypothetical protein